MAYGRHRGDAQSGDVDIGSDGLTIEVIGVRPQLRHLAAVLIEPAGQTAALEVVQAWRADWYRSRYPVVVGADGERGEAGRAGDRRKGSVGSYVVEDREAERDTCGP